MDILQIKNLLHQTDTKSNLKFEELFSDKQQDEIIDFLEMLDKKIIEKKGEDNFLIK